MGHYLLAQNSPSVLSLVIPGLGVCKSCLLCQMAPSYTLPVRESRGSWQRWRRNKGLACFFLSPSCFDHAPSCLFPAGSTVYAPARATVPSHGISRAHVSFPDPCRTCSSRPISETPAPAWEDCSPEACVSALQALLLLSWSSFPSPEAPGVGAACCICSLYDTLGSLFTRSRIC